MGPHYRCWGIGVGRLSVAAAHECEVCRETATCQFGIGWISTTINQESGFYQVSMNDTGSHECYKKFRIGCVPITWYRLGDLGVKTPVPGF